MAKTVKNRKPVSSATKGIICLVLLCALTVFLSCLGVAGMKLDNEGVNVLLPWVPVSSSNWPASLPLNRALGGGAYIDYTAKAEEGATLDEVVKVISTRLDGLGESDHEITVQGEDTIRLEMRNMDSERAASIRSLAIMPGHFTFQDTEGNTVFTDKDVTGAELTVNEKQTAYLLNVTITDEAAQKLTEANISYVSVYLDQSQVSSLATVSGNKISMSFLTSNYNTAANSVFLLRTGPVAATLTASNTGAVDASSGSVKRVVLLVAAALLLVAALYMIIVGKLTGVSGLWTVWCAVLLGLFFVATIVVPSVNALNVGCMIAMLLGILLAVYTAVTRTDAVSDQTKEGFGPKQATKVGFRSTAKQIWIVHAAALVLSMLLMIIPSLKSTGYTLAAFVTASAFTVVLMRLFQACFTAISKKTALFGKTK